MLRFHARKRFAVAAILIALLAPTATFAADGDVRLKAGEWSPHAGIGFIAEPDAFLLGVGLDFGVASWLSLGPLLQAGFSDDDTIVAPTLNFHFGIDLSGVSNQYVRRIEPFVQAGLGMAYIEKERGNDEDDDLGFLMNGGVGAQYWLTDEMAVGTSLLFNGMPEDVLDENFFFSWQLVTFRYRF
jgi:opacity protein-like surface antigen